MATTFQHHVIVINRWIFPLNLWLGWSCQIHSIEDVEPSHAALMCLISSDLIRWIWGWSDMRSRIFSVHYGDHLVFSQCGYIWWLLTIDSYLVLNTYQKQNPDCVTFETTVLRNLQCNVSGYIDTRQLHSS